MKLSNKTLRTRILAGTAAVTLSFGVVSCSEAEDAANSASDAAGSATSAAGSAVNEATKSNDSGEAGESSAADSSDSADSADGTATNEGDSADGSGAEGETTEVEAADGSMITIPSAVAAAAEKAGFTVPESIEEGTDGQSLVTYAEGLIANSEESGAQPVVGKIAETWLGEGGLASSIGLPTGPEEATDNGWTQEFTSGVINWMDDGSGNFTADVQTN